VATKAGLRRRGAWTNDGAPEHIREACEKSLRALQTEQIWLYQFHAPDPKVPFERSIEAFAELHRAGKFRWFGLSNVSVKQIEKAQQILPVVSVQNRLNPYFRESVSVAKECARRNITFLAYSPVGGAAWRRSSPVRHPPRAGPEIRPLRPRHRHRLGPRSEDRRPHPRRTVEYAVDSAGAAAGVVKGICAIEEGV
jgi:aryl-alcohol dehydrogenase-like predicted oxidoreductase